MWCSSHHSLRYINERERMLIDILLFVLIAALIVWAAQALGLPQPIVVVVVVLLIIALLFRVL